MINLNTSLHMKPELVARPETKTTEARSLNRLMKSTSDHLTEATGVTELKKSENLLPKLGYRLFVDFQESLEEMIDSKNSTGSIKFLAATPPLKSCQAEQ